MTDVAQRQQLTAATTNNIVTKITTTSIETEEEIVIIRTMEGVLPANKTTTASNEGEAEEDVRLGANKYSERQPLGTSAQTKDYQEPPPAPFFKPGELLSWSFYRAGIAEFIATFLFLYVTVLTVMGVAGAPNKCNTVGIQGIAWAFGGMIFALVYCWYFRSVSSSLK